MWRSLQEKELSEDERRERAEAEHPGGFLQASDFVSADSLAKPAAPDSMASPDVSGPGVSGMTRRGFLEAGTLTAAALAVEGCIRRPEEKILPYAKQPEYVVPGRPLHFATSLPHPSGDALGVLVTCHEGRPTKVEGNPDHPASLGRTDAYAQASVWDLYDPDRSHRPARKKSEGSLSESTYQKFDAALEAMVRKHRGDQGAGLCFLSEPTSSPSFIRLRSSIRAVLPKARFFTHAAVHDDNAREGAKIAFGQDAIAFVEYAQARVIVSFDADFLSSGVASVRNGQGFGQGRRLGSSRDNMSRLYVVEGTFSVTGAMADHRLRTPARDVGTVLLALAKRLVESGKLEMPGLASSIQKQNTSEVDSAWVDAAVKDLLAHRGLAPIVVGPRQPPYVHALAHALNVALGNHSGCMRLYAPADAERNRDGDLKTLIPALRSASSLVILGGNPAFDAPADLGLPSALKRDGLTSIHLATHRNETSKLCEWHVPEAHPFEAWGDSRCFDGTVAVQQPLIAPLWGGRSAIEILATFAGESSTRGHKIVRQTMRESFFSGLDFEQRWRSALHAGVVGQDPSARVAPMATRDDAISNSIQGRTPSQGALGARNLEVQFVPSAALFDGRYANNPWLLELPDPMTKMVWDNAAIVSKKTRDALGLRDGQIVRLSDASGRAVEIPVMALPGHADYSVTLHIGWGRRDSGRYGTKQVRRSVVPEPNTETGGFNVYPLRARKSLDFSDGYSLDPLPKQYDLVQTQTHASMEGRPIAIDATLAEYRKEPDFASFRTVEFVNTPPLWEEVDYNDGHKWGMTIDLTSCTGCNACVVACQSENNIPVVGKREVKRGREMSWLRIDRYFVGDDEDSPAVSLQPVACQHCEEAPCENVCPVNATAHSPEGLNDMAYNRCIGTRYCANNCPYKVRRFNYLDWHSKLEDPFAMHGKFSETRKMQFNPNVTVRSRGVMEKCSYCVQRIEEARYAAKREQRAIGDNEIVTACQQACSTGSIVFGDLNNPKSRVARLARTDRRYKLLAEVGTQPRTTYLAKIRNPSPTLPGTSGAKAKTPHATQGSMQQPKVAAKTETAATKQQVKGSHR